MMMMFNADSVQGVIRDVTTMSPSVADGRDINTVAIFVCTALALAILIYDGLIDSLYVCKCELNSLFCSVV